jgi:hypothetical protein
MFSKEAITTFEEDGLTFTEVIRQEYTGNNCVFSGGFVAGADPACDTMYLRFEKDQEDGTHAATSYLLRPDEMAAVAWVASGVLWSKHVDEVEDDA